MKQKILIVDDEKSIRMLLRNFLSKKYEVESRSDGIHALEWLEDNIPDLIICDLLMPNMDGYRFLEKLRQRGYTKHIPVIILSGVESSKERIRCYQLGAQDFLTKPFNPEELTEIISKDLYPVQYAAAW